MIYQFDRFKGESSKPIVITFANEIPDGRSSEYYEKQAKAIARLIALHLPKGVARRVFRELSVFYSSWNKEEKAKWEKDGASYLKEYEK